MRSVRDDCLDHIVHIVHIVHIGETHLRRALREYLERNHLERNHLERNHLERNHHGLDNALNQPRAGPANDNGEVQRKQRLGALLNCYERRAA